MVHRWINFSFALQWLRGILINIESVQLAKQKAHLIQSWTFFSLSYRIILIIVSRNSLTSNHLVVQSAAQKLITRIIYDFFLPSILGLFDMLAISCWQGGRLNHIYIVNVCIAFYPRRWMKRYRTPWEKQANPLSYCKFLLFGRNEWLPGRAGNYSRMQNVILEFFWERLFSPPPPHHLHIFC